MKYLSFIAFSLISSNLWAAGGVAPTTVPEPETLFLFGIGVVALILSRNKRK
ncbi:PEP-CTERM sorting domain-containing protein [Sulfuriferula multivorans]|uniref:PEP-CTERM sorting domain-containing protein n=1 Tax=Sulfuriferula multivorans TaxID=1559896 RepID=UPI000F5BA987|nr:PEP-CTERM sorting domain-containing protein [Sulfuriferula multivorans]